MAKRSARLERIFVVARSAERQGRQEMGRAQLLLDAEVSRLDELRSYRRVYDRKTFSGDDMQPAHWADYQTFLSRLGNAVDEQQKHVLSARQNRDRHRSHWMAKRQHMDSLQRVCDRYRKTEELQEERKLQKSLDDRPPARNAFDD